MNNRLILILAAMALLAAGTVAHAGQAYLNEKFGFRLTVKDSWKKYRVHEGTTSWPHEIKAPAFYFCLPTSVSSWKSETSPGGYAAIFAVSVFTVQQWKRLTGSAEAEMDVGDLTILTNSPHYVYTYSMAQSVPDDLWPRIGDVSEIIATFRLEK